MFSEINYTISHNAKELVSLASHLPAFCTLLVQKNQSSQLRRGRDSRDMPSDMPWHDVPWGHWHPIWSDASYLVWPQLSMRAVASSWANGLQDSNAFSMGIAAMVNPSSKSIAHSTASQYKLNVYSIWYESKWVVWALDRLDVDGLFAKSLTKYVFVVPMIQSVAAGWVKCISCSLKIAKCHKKTKPWKLTKEWHLGDVDVHKLNRYKSVLQPHLCC